MKIVAWVPIKMNNERLPGKNVLPLAGKPLCRHVLGELQKLEKVDAVYAFCSEQELDEYLPEGVERIDRDTSLNSFSTKINDVIRAFSEIIDADIYVYAQVTSPFLKKDTIQKGLNAVCSGKYDSALSVKVLHDFLWKEKNQPLNYDPANIARTQDLEPYYQETGGFYIYTKELIQKTNRRTGYKPFLVEISETESIDIDYLEDYELAKSVVLKDYGRENDIYNIKILMEWNKFLIEGGDVNDYFEAHSYHSVAIYGCGILGRLLYEQIDKNKIEVKAFIDKKGISLHGVPGILPEEVEKIKDADIMVITPGFSEKEIRQKYASTGIDLVCISDLFGDFFLRILENEKKNLNSKCEKQLNEQLLSNYHFLYGKVSESLRKKKFREIFNKAKTGEIVFPLIDLCITTQCTLSCKKCFHLIPNYHKDGRIPFHIKLEQIEKDFDQLHEAVDYIVKVNILGGEPFLHPQIDDIIAYILTKSKVGYFRIVSNGTIIPEDSTCQKLNNDRVLVCLSDYNTGKEKISQIINKFNKYGISYVIEREQIWHDFGDLKKRDLTEDELRMHYEKCDYARCKALMEGKLHTCAFAKHAERQGLIPDYNESLNIHAFSGNNLRVRLKEFLNFPCFKACIYCNAPNQENSKPIVAGEQE